MSGDESADEPTGPRRATDLEATDLQATDLRFVGPATATVLADAPFGPDDVLSRRVSYRMLTDAGVNPGVAARIRREHSLSWSFEGGEDLDRRSVQIRGLRDDERAWIAASSGDWESRESATADGGATAADAERAWQERSRPEPVTAISDIDRETAVLLAEGGITSVRSLVVADPAEVADSLDIPMERVADWHRTARDLL